MGSDGQNQNTFSCVRKTHDRKGSKPQGLFTPKMHWFQRLLGPVHTNPLRFCVLFECCLLALTQCTLQQAHWPMHHALIWKPMGLSTPATNWNSSEWLQSILSILDDSQLVTGVDYPLAWRANLFLILVFSCRATLLRFTWMQLWMQAVVDVLDLMNAYWIGKWILMRYMR